jgi:hypothetical protein
MSAPGVFVPILHIPDKFFTTQTQFASCYMKMHIINNLLYCQCNYLQKLKIQLRSQLKTRAATVSRVAATPREEYPAPALRCWASCRTDRSHPRDGLPSRRQAARGGNGGPS